MLAMFEPMTLPKAISGEPRRAAVRLAASSGAEVPKATMVRPITSGLIPQRCASRLEFFTRKSPPK